MSETKWTPGPWRISTGNMANVIEGPTGKENISEWDDGYAPVATAQPCCASYQHADREANLQANLHLVAAAPDLYAALDQLLDDMGADGLSVCQAAKDQAIAALRKARGEQ